MEEINTHKYNEMDKSYKINNINSFQQRQGRSYDNTLNRNIEDSNNYTSNKYEEKYNNINSVNHSKKSYNCRCVYHCNPCFCPYIVHCPFHHIHFHHMHNLHPNICSPIANTNRNISRIDNNETNKANNDLIKEVSELKNECQKFKKIKLIQIKGEKLK